VRGQRCDDHIARIDGIDYRSLPNASGVYPRRVAPDVEAATGQLGHEPIDELSTVVTAVADENPRTPGLHLDHLGSL
jgi:hypothetical protein